MFGLDPAICDTRELCAKFRNRRILLSISNSLATCFSCVLDYKLAIVSIWLRVARKCIVCRFSMCWLELTWQLNYTSRVVVVSVSNNLLVTTANRSTEPGLLPELQNTRLLELVVHRKLRDSASTNNWCGPELGLVLGLNVDHRYIQILMISMVWMEGEWMCQCQKIILHKLLAGGWQRKKW